MHRSTLFSLLVTVFVIGATGCSTSHNKPLPLEPTTIEPKHSLEQHAEADEGNGFGGTGRVQTQIAKSAEQVNRAKLRHTNVLDNGFGGTGQTASGFGGTGFIGTVIEFGSIWVNGVEVGLGQKTKIVSNAGKNTESLNAEDLRIGQQVWFETQPSQEKTTTAEIHVFYLMSGTIEAIKTQDMATEIRVNGQRIYIGSQTVIPDSVELAVGESVRISGLPVYEKLNPQQKTSYSSADSQASHWQRTNAWEATLIEANANKETWFNSVPNVNFSEKVNRVMMHPRWATSYQLGEFKHLKPGMATPPKIKVVGQETSKQGVK